MPAVRDTLRRFDDYGIPKDLSGKTVIDIGSNVGAVSFEFARRGATVVGIEYRQDRCELCNDIAAVFGIGNVHFCRMDLNDPFHRDVILNQQITYLVDTWFKKVLDTNFESAKYDIVWCSSVDEYIQDRPKFYSMLRQLTKQILYLESNVQGLHEDQVAKIQMIEAGLEGVEYVGAGHSGGISRRRKLYRWKPDTVWTNNKFRA
jgi:2-polyprenyl-3-methyl-5-hydroxy-6-metoxy-1,4-benzoquinol methylase